MSDPHATAHADAPTPTLRANVAYFSMEIGLDAQIPTYAGGLGVLAGDSVRSAADLGLSFVAVTLLHREGYFSQRIAEDGRQEEAPNAWDPAAHMTPQAPLVVVHIGGRPVKVRAWRYEVRGCEGHVAPVLLLDTDLPENSEADRQITSTLYSSDRAGRLAQEIVLGVGGLRMLRALGYAQIDHCHMNEGHASLLVLELLREEAAAMQASMTDPQVAEAVRRRGIFTTHTPVAAGHDTFPMELVRELLPPELLPPLESPRGMQSCCPDGHLNMTLLGFSHSRYINGVAKRHGEVSRRLFRHHAIDSITNGVHAPTWVSAPFADLYDRRLPGWRKDGFSLRSAQGLPLDELRHAHRVAKRALIELVNFRGDAGFEEDVFTIGFARRATAYKRASLVLSDLDQLRSIARHAGRLQIVFAGKAHPNDAGGKEMIRQIMASIAELRGEVPAAYLANYDMALARVLIPGVDLWLNTPLPPLEASGTSGMKAALNGVPSLSTLDGWWVEGHIEGITGWAIGRDQWRGEEGVDMHATSDAERDAADAESLYDKLEQVIVPMFYSRPEQYAKVMRSAIAINGSFFTTQRMMLEYVVKAYVA